jgi:endoglucanase
MNARIMTASARIAVGCLCAWVAGTLLASWAGTTASAAETPAKAPDAFAQNQRLGRGVNILGYDPIWKDRQKGRFQERYFRLIKEAGFSNVRIVLHPLRDGAVGADHKISAAWLETLDWAIRHTLSNGLMAIVDFHDYTVVNDPVSNKALYLALWRQLADRYKNEPNEVLFELLNEPNGKLTPQLWNPMLREVLAVIRQSNPRRTLVVGPTYWNSFVDLPLLDLPEEDRNLIVTVHYYQPFAFTHQGTPWTDMKDKLGVAWKGSTEDQRAIVRDFEKAQAWARQHARPIFLGEFGAYDKGDMDSRVRWTNFIAREAEARGWSWAYWQFDGDFIVYDVKHNAWVEPILKALVSPAGASVGRTAAGSGASAKAPQVIILKLDDVIAYGAKDQPPVSPRWQRTADFIEHANIKASFGIIGFSLEYDNPAYFSWIKELHRRGNIEFWNHGYRNRKDQDKTGEFEGSLEEQTAALRKTQTLASEKLGIELVAFGPHWSGTNQQTAKALDGFPAIKMCFYDPQGSKKFVFERVMTLENPIFVPDPDKFKTFYEKAAKEKPCLALQGHPNAWDDQRWQGFVKIIDYLKSQDCIFMTPSEYCKKAMVR